MRSILNIFTHYSGTLYEFHFQTTHCAFTSSVPLFHNCLHAVGEEAFSRCDCAAATLRVLHDDNASPLTLVVLQPPCSGHVKVGHVFFLRPDGQKAQWVRVQILWPQGQGGSGGKYGNLMRHDCPWFHADEWTLREIRRQVGNYTFLFISEKLLVFTFLIGSMNTE